MIHVVVPILNEEPNVDGLLEGIRERLLPSAAAHRIVIVDDGSTDAGPEKALAASRPDSPVEVLRHGRNLGPGAAFRTGFLHVLKTAAATDLVATLEGDRTSDPAVLARMLERAWADGDDVVLASCYLYGGGIAGTAWHRVGLSHLANGLMKKTLGLSGLATLSSFYRVYRVSALRALERRYGAGIVRSAGFECMVEILYRAARLGLRISEVPMRLDGTRRAGKSKMRTMRTSLAYLRLSALAVLGRL